MTISSKNKERYDFIDLLKAIAIFFVVVYHFNNIQIDFINEKGNVFYLNYFIKSILSICVPVFFFVNGALLLNKPELDIKKHIFKILNIIILIIIWGIISLIALSVIRHERLSFFDIIKGIFTLKEGWINHLWFLEALIVIYIFFPLIFSTFKNNLNYFYFFFTCVLLLTFGNKLLAHCATTISFLSQKFMSKNFSLNYFSDFNAFRGIYGYSIGYFLLGGLMFYKKDLLGTKKYTLLSIIAITISIILLFSYGVLESKRQNKIWDIVWDAYDTIYTLIIVASTYILSLKYKHKGLMGKWIKLIGENSLGIYLLHRIIGAILEPIYFNSSFNTTIIANIIFAFTILFLSLLMVLGFKRVPIVKYLFLIQ